MMKINEVRPGPTTLRMSDRPIREFKTPKDAVVREEKDDEEADS